MNISFVITTFNIENYILKCLKSVAEIARPGDQIILVDDGSYDNTVPVIEKFIADEGFGQDREYTPIYLEENTVGGVGTGGNIGIENARREGLFFVDGDDWVLSFEFENARNAFEVSGCDILIANYKEWDEAASKSKLPADHKIWKTLEEWPSKRIEARDFALKLIAVPWRKFYRMDFVKKHKLRYPEGDFFFEDNPFHWSVCLAAKKITFIDIPICMHRINRPGQTMASVGTELIAFFEHYQTIEKLLPKRNRELKTQAMRWIVDNMIWHINRLQPVAFECYIHEAIQTFDTFNAKIWTDTILPYLTSFDELKPLFVYIKQGKHWAAIQQLFDIYSERMQRNIIAVQSQTNNTLFKYNLPTTPKIVSKETIESEMARHNRLCREFRQKVNPLEGM